MDHPSLEWLDPVKDSNARLAPWSLFRQLYQNNILLSTIQERGMGMRMPFHTVNKFTAGERGRSVVDYSLYVLLISVLKWEFEICEGRN